MSKLPLKRLKIDGQAFVKPLVDTTRYDHQDRLFFLLVGPTGAGKSSFIEALANDHTLGISKDQLESFTQTVTAYEIVNVYFDQYRISLLDCPGFSDTSLSELEIIEMVNTWMKANRVSYIDIILYFCPITDTRLPGTRRKTMEMWKSLVSSSSKSSYPAGRKDEVAVTIVTTMWDQVWCERVEQRAEKNYNQLKDGVWKEMIDKGSGITKFKNTQESALGNIDDALEKFVDVDDTAYNISWFAVQDVPLMNTGHGVFLYEELTSRIEAVRKRRLTLQLDLHASLGDPTLQSLFQKEHKHNECLLEKYEQQLTLLKSPPEPGRYTIGPEIDLVVSGSSDEESILSSSSHDPAPPSPTAHDETAIDDELVPSSRNSAAPSNDPDVASPAATVPVDSTTSNAPLDPITASFTTSTQLSPQSSVVHSGDAALVPASREVAILPQHPLPLTPSHLLHNHINAPQAEAAMVSSTEPTHAPHASSARTLDDAGRLPRRKPSMGWMKALLRRIKGMFRRKHASKNATVG
ncbi:hypothetical protein CVT24_013295 [Panaeolus cyanescens]|uniref:G domain-containing protein n=1 Tax=Panaeolus cyanescens TaxID=181874 RepID=A0A409YMB1_9AGAR|nr:hypothetical protein CVT24_013295 [Panaeolus cyanescens]